MSTLAQYVEYGNRTTAPAPFRFTGGRFRCYLLEGDAGLIAGLCDRVLNVPAAGTVKYRPLLGKHLLLMAGHFDQIVADSPTFAGWGYAEETQISLLVPVLASGGAGPERVCMLCPYILVDNPVSLVGGREDYGYPKSLGRFDPPDALSYPLEVRAYGGNFSTASRAEWQPLFEISRAGTSTAPPAFPPEWYDLEQTPALIDSLSQHEDLELPDLGAIRAIIGALTGKQSMQVFLKQFRDAQVGTDACYQAVVEAPIEYTSSTISPSLEEWEVAVNKLDSHPIVDELGVRSPQRTRATFDARMDVLAPPGRVVAP